MNLPLSENKESILVMERSRTVTTTAFHLVFKSGLIAKRVQIYNSFLILQYFLEKKVKLFLRTFKTEAKN